MINETEHIIRFVPSHTPESASASITVMLINKEKKDDAGTFHIPIIANIIENMQTANKM
jgi:hypothetical protein